MEVDPKHVGVASRRFRGFGRARRPLAEWARVGSLGSLARLSLGGSNVPLPKMRRDGLFWLVAMSVGVTLIGRSPVASADIAARKTPVSEAVRKAQPSVVSISSEKKAASTSRWPFSSEESQRPG